MGAHNERLLGLGDDERFTFISRIRSWQEQKRGDVKHQRLPLEKEAFRRGVDNEAEILRTINAIRYQSPTTPIERGREGSKRGLIGARNLI